MISVPKATRGERFWSWLEHSLASERFWWIICLFCAALSAFAARHSMNPDGLSYLDLATEAIRGGPVKLLSAYWSPGYPALISLVLFITRPSPSYEFPLTHLINLLLFVAALWVFTAFIRYLLRLMNGNGRCVTPFAFATFVWYMLRFIGLEAVNPDLSVAVIVFLVAAVTCRLYLPATSWKHYIALGLVLGIGYYFKAAVLPLSVIFLVLLFVLPPFSYGPSRTRLLVTAAVLLVTVSPLVIALSSRAHTFTIGESGRLNYIWFVNQRQWSGGLEPPEPGSIGEHPAPKLLTKPVTLEFASPIGGTYPLWFDPSYWYSSTKAHFDLRQQVKAIGVNLKAYKEMLTDSVAFAAGAIVLFVFSLQRRNGTGTRVLWWQMAWPLAAFAMYTVVTVENRYVGAFFILFWVALYTVLLARVDHSTAVAVLATVLCAEMIPFTAHLASTGGGAMRSLLHPPSYETTGRALIGMGVHEGDLLAVVGYAHNCYYARYARARVVAQIPDTHEFWQLSPAELTSVEDRLAAIGVKALLAPSRPSAPAPAGWKDISGSDSDRLSVLLLSPTDKNR